MSDYCESMVKKEGLDEQFFDDAAVIPSIAIFSYKPAPPEETPAAPHKEVEGQKEGQKKDTDLECELQLSPVDVDKVLVNGVELTKDSSLATPRAACSFLGQAVALS